MQLPPIDRQTAASTGAEAALSSVGRVVPVAPVNPADAGLAAPAPADPLPGVVNRIGEGPSPVAPAEPTYLKPQDAAPKPPEEATAPRDWTIQRPEPEKVEEPPKEPISKMLLDFLQAVWRASASAVEVAQAQNQAAPPPTNPAASAGQAAKEAVTYSPSKVRGNERL